MKIQINPRNYDAVRFGKKDFAREGVDHDDVEFNEGNDFTATVSKEVFEIISNSWGKKNVSEVKGEETKEPKEPKK